MNTTARKAVFAESENAQRLHGRVSVFRDPAVSKTGVIFDMVKPRTNIAKLLADTLDERAHMGAIPFRAVPGDEIFAVDEVVDLTVADILAGFFGQQPDDPELRQGQIGRPSGPQCAI